MDEIDFGVDLADIDVADPPFPASRGPLAPPAGVAPTKKPGLDSGIFDDVAALEVPDLDVEVPDLKDLGIEEPAESLGADLMAAFNGEPERVTPLADRLRALAESLRLEGRDDEADAVTEAIAMLNLF